MKDLCEAVDSKDREAAKSYANYLLHKNNLTMYFQTNYVDVLCGDLTFFFYKMYVHSSKPNSQAPPRWEFYDYVRFYSDGSIFTYKTKNPICTLHPKKRHLQIMKHNESNNHLIICTFDKNKFLLRSPYPLLVEKTFNCLIEDRE
jgi:hypothetical protein